MKKIICELCECTEFTKEGGMFVCQGCGTKYSAEEARGMMHEVEGSEQIPTTSYPPPKNPNQQQIDNILILATTAYEAQNYAESENYCNQAIVLDTMCYKAWNLKGKAVGWQSKIDNLRIEEASHSFCKAIDCAPEEEKEELKLEAVEELKRLGLALIDLRKSRFSCNPIAQELDGFTYDKETVFNALLVLLAHGNAVKMPKGFLDQVATIMNEAGVTALDKVQNAWKGIENPSVNDLQTYLDWNGNICEVFRQAIATSDDDDEADIIRYKNLIIALKDPIYKYSKKLQWHSWNERYEWVMDCSLTPESVEFRNSEVREIEAKINELEKKTKEKQEAIKKKAEEEKNARIKAYWEVHADEKSALESEKKQLSDKISKLTLEVIDLEDKIKAATPTEKNSSEKEYDDLKEQRKELENRRSKLGLFAGKEKKQISDEIAAIDGRMGSLKTIIEEEKKMRDAETDKVIAPLKNRIKELNKEIIDATMIINEIDTEFAKDPDA